MSFSERMKESLGTEGARVEVLLPREPVHPGGVANTTVKILGGTRDARVDAIVMRLIEARRHWLAPDGQRLSEAELGGRDRHDLMPTWERKVIREFTVDVGENVEAHGEHEVPVELSLPDDCGTTDPARVITVNAQADIKEQIDPTGTATLRVAPAA